MDVEPPLRGSGGRFPVGRRSASPAAPICAAGKKKSQPRVQHDSRQLRRSGDQIQTLSQFALLIFRSPLDVNRIGSELQGLSRSGWNRPQSGSRRCGHRSFIAKRPRTHCGLCLQPNRVATIAAHRSHRWTQIPSQRRKHEDPKTRSGRILTRIQEIRAVALQSASIAVN